MRGTNHSLLQPCSLALKRIIFSGSIFFLSTLLWSGLHEGIAEDVTLCWFLYTFSLDWERTVIASFFYSQGNLCHQTPCSPFIYLGIQSVFLWQPWGSCDECENPAHTSEPTLLQRRQWSQEGPGFFLMLYGGLEGGGKSLNVGDFVFHPHSLNAETVFFCASVKIRTFGRSAQSAGKASNPSRLSWPHELRVPSVLALRKVGEHICAMCACSDRFHLSQRWKKGVLSANRSSIFTDLLCFVSVGTCRSSKVPSRVKHILKRTVILKR